MSGKTITYHNAEKTVSVEFTELEINFLYFQYGFGFGAGSFTTSLFQTLLLAHPSTFRIMAGMFPEESKAITSWRDGNLHERYMQVMIGNFTT